MFMRVYAEGFPSTSTSTSTSTSPSRPALRRRDSVAAFDGPLPLSRSEIDCPLMMLRLEVLLCPFALGRLVPPPPAAPSGQPPSSEVDAGSTVVAQPAPDRSRNAGPQSHMAHENAAEIEAYLRAHGRCVARGRTRDHPDTETGEHGARATARNGSVPGRMPPAVIQHIIREEYGKLRACYDEGLRRNPALQGQLSV